MQAYSDKLTLATNFNLRLSLIFVIGSDCKFNFSSTVFYLPTRNILCINIGFNYTCNTNAFVPSVTELLMMICTVALWLALQGHVIVLVRHPGVLDIPVTNIRHHILTTRIILNNTSILIHINGDNQSASNNRLVWMTK